MADNYEKLPVQHSLNRIAITRAAELIQNTGRALPCRVVAVSGSIVTVAFEVNAGNQTLPQITIPKNESRWIRYPIQVGDFGVTQPAETYLGGVSGLGGGIARLSQGRGNLATLMFTPCGSTEFAAVNPNAAFISGPADVVLQTADGASSIVIGEGAITFVAGGRTWTLSAAGFEMATGIIAETHQHTSEASGTPTGGPIA